MKYKLKRIHFSNVSEAASTAEDRRQYRRSKELQAETEKEIRRIQECTKRGVLAYKLEGEK